MKPTDSIPCLVVNVERDHADGVHCSANVIRPAASFFISLRNAHRRRGLSAPRLLDEYKALFPVPGTLGVSRSEIKEEAKPGDIRGGRYPAFPASAPISLALCLSRASRDAHWSN